MKKLNENKLRTLRISRGWSQEFVADKINLTQAAYSKIELGQVRLTIDRATELAKLYNVDPKYFFIEDNKQSSHLNVGKYNIDIDTINTEQYFESSSIQPAIEYYQKIIEDKNKQIELLLFQIKNLRKERKKFWNLIKKLTKNERDKQ